MSDYEIKQNYQAPGENNQSMLKSKSVISPKRHICPVNILS